METALPDPDVLELVVLRRDVDSDDAYAARVAASCASLASALVAPPADTGAVFIEWP